MQHPMWEEAAEKVDATAYIWYNIIIKYRRWYYEYVELHKDNYNTFSNGYALLMQAIGAELDVVFKEYCDFNTLERKTITDYARFILQNDADIVNQEIILREYDIEIQPFKGWNAEQAGQTLFWWFAFTGIKHNRYDKLNQAKQENILNMLHKNYDILETANVSRNNKSCA